MLIYVVFKQKIPKTNNNLAFKALLIINFIGINLFEEDKKNFIASTFIEKVNDVPIALTFTLQRKKTQKKYPYLF